ncbi:MAG TPA: hypothetical protein VEU55_00730 [Gemmatimonadales bacterium]|nr:hypothetical protein [Gemmatimonadales bacterium]
MTGTPRARLVGAGAILLAAVVLRYYEVPPFPTWFYVVAWYPTLVILDQVVVLRGGESLLARPGTLITMLWWSAVIWFAFEAINFRLENWYYVFLPANRLERWVGITVALATVAPAVVLPERLLDRLGVWHDLHLRPLPLRPKDLQLALWVGSGMLTAVLAFPRYLYPLTWGALWLIAEPLLYRDDPGHSLLADITRGQWGRIARLMAGGLFAGVLWEGFNAVARGRWIYTVPFLERLKIFEMPPIGFLGFPFFALEVWSLYHLFARHTTRRTVLASVVFALLVLGGMDRWTVSSTAPRLADLPGVTNGVLGRLRGAGWTDVFRVARAPAAELAYSANLSPEEARTARDAARLVTLRGLGTAHAAALIGGGIGSVEALAHTDLEAVWRLVHASARPTRAEVRVWIDAARRN